MTHFHPANSQQPRTRGQQPTAKSQRPKANSKQSTANGQRSTAPGFTLIEAIVSLAILSVGLIPAFAQVTTSNQVSRSIRHTLTASMLAQEGIELVRGVRDDNWFAGAAFDQDLDSCTGGCRMHYPEPFLLPLAGDPPLRIDPQGRYQYTTGIETPYMRRIAITQVSPVHLKVESVVTWDDRGETRTVLVEGYLFDWLNP